MKNRSRSSVRRRGIFACRCLVPLLLLAQAGCTNLPTVVSKPVDRGIGKINWKADESITQEQWQERWEILAKESPSAKGIEGFPYFLPTSTVEITLESKKDDKGAHKEMSLVTGAKLMPDRSKLFTLESVTDPFTASTHEFKVQDGMLTLVSTSDDNKTVDIVGELAKLAADIYTFGQTGFGAQSQGLTEEQKPSNEEILEIYGKIAPGPHRFAFARGEPGSVALPGTGEVLRLEKSVSPVFGGADIGVAPPAGDEKGYHGIYARTLRPMKVVVALNIRMEKFFLWRVGQMKAKKDAADKKLPKLEQQAANHATEKQRLTGVGTSLDAQREARKKELVPIKDEREKLDPSTQAWRDRNAACNRLEEIIADITAKITANAKELEALEAEIETNTAALQAVRKDVALGATGGPIEKNTAWAADNGLKKVSYTATAHDAIIMVPDESLLVRVPVLRSRLGLSKNTVTLQSGILLEYKTERPSQGVEVIKIPVKIAGAVVGIPAKIFSLKIDHSTKQKELLTVENELAKLQDDIAKAKDGPGEHASSVEKLSQEKELLQLQKDIAVLRQQLAEAAEEP